MEAGIGNTGKTLRAQYLQFAAATVASQMVYALYSLVDGLFVSRGVNEYAMSAVDLALPYTNVLFAVAVLFAVGTSTLIAIYLGEGRLREANRLFSQNAAVLLILGAVLTACILIFPEPFIKLLGADALTHDYVRSYLLGLVPFSVCFILSYNMEVLIKTDGCPRKAFRTVLAGCLCNCVLDYIAIFRLKMGVFGAGLATGLSQLFVCLVYLRHFRKEKTTFRFERFQFDLKIYRRLLPLGVSDGVTEICSGLMIFLFNRTILRCIGSDGLVSYTVIAYIHTVVINAMIGTSAAAQPLVSYQHGKKNYVNCRKLLRYALLLAAAIEAAVLLLLQCGGGLIVRAFLGGEWTALHGASLSALRKYSLGYLLIGFNVVIGGYLTARERPRGAMAISIGRGFVLQSLALLTLAYAVGGNALWFAPLVSEALCLLLSMLFLRRSLREDGI